MINYHYQDLADRDDLHELFDRPTKKSRPRTKDRPDYSKAKVGRVLTIDRGRYQCLIENRQVRAKKATRLGRGSIIVGDQVKLVGDLSGRKDTLARIVEVEPRTSVLRRTADDLDPSERPIVANADQVVVVTSLADPPPSQGMIDRIMVAGFDAGIKPVLCLTKADLADPDELISGYSPLDIPIVVTQPGADLTPIRDLLAGHISVLVGRSGVGKSTLINALIPGADRQTSQISQATRKGRHTSTSAEALRLPAHNGIEGWAIDTPGLRGFGLNHVDPKTLTKAFTDLAQYTEYCPRGCEHTASDIECRLDQAVSENKLSLTRLVSYRRILSSLKKSEQMY